MTTRISLQTVKAAKPKAKRYVIWDSYLKGFGLRVSPEGRKTYILKARVKGRQVFFTLGEHGSPLTPDTARDKATIALGKAKDGINPAVARKADENATMTVDDLCKEYLKEVEGGRVLTKFDVPKAASTLTDRARINRHIVPLIGKKRVPELTKADIDRMLRDIAGGKTAVDEKTDKKRGRARVTGGQGTATRTVGLLGGIFSYAIEKGYCTENPVRGVQRYRDNKNERFLSPEELGRMGVALKKAEADEKDLYAIAAIRFLILSGCRKSEALTLKRDHVDINHACLRLPTSKTGKKVVPLGAAALALLTDLPRVNKNPYVFPGWVEGKHYIGLPRFFENIRKAAKLPEVRLHDLRHSFASAGAAGGLGLPLIGALLGHKDTKTTARYAHLADSPVKAAADRIAKSIKAAMDAKPKAEVKQMRRPARRN